MATSADSLTSSVPVSANVFAVSLQVVTVSESTPVVTEFLTASWADLILSSSSASQLVIWLDIELLVTVALMVSYNASPLGILLTKVTNAATASYFPELERNIVNSGGNINSLNK